MGHYVFNHSITHPDLRTLSYAGVKRELGKPGVVTTYGRPPYGAYNDNVRAVAASCGYKAIVMWKGSTNDGRFDLQDGTALTPGDIVLMHWRTDLLVDLQKVVQMCNEQGFTIARLEDYLQ